MERAGIVPATRTRRPFSAAQAPEAAGVELLSGQITSVPLVHNFRLKTLIFRRFAPATEPPGVPSGPLVSTQSWRYFEDG